MVWFKKDIFSKGEEKSDKSVKVPQGMWIKCDSCGEIIYQKELEKNFDVCPKCSHHFRISARRRMEITLDEGSFRELFIDLEAGDPLGFVDQKTYKDRIKATQAKAGEKDAFICGEGLLDGRKVMAGSFEFSFMGGSMGSVVGEKITSLIETGIELKAPVIVFSASGGARMHEGIFSLMQMAKTSAALAKLRDAAVPYVSVLTDPTTGGVTASFAMLGDVIVAEPKALIGFAGPRVIAETIKQKLPEGFQRSEYLLEHGMVDMIVERKNMRQALIKITALLTA
ncbi:MAG: acetyl-CoA carboxylase, carboxyltransferase subunit beta [Deltaproteobacteria bacterium]|nr:acetyl-CoA carboxylase, carboxyltransferase subunit beta [Deltaproteobacteria bacterium]